MLKETSLNAISFQEEDFDEEMKSKFDDNLIRFQNNFPSIMKVHDDDFLDVDAFEDNVTSVSDNCDHDRVEKKVSL